MHRSTGSPDGWVGRDRRVRVAVGLLAALLVVASVAPAAGATALTTAAGGGGAAAPTVAGGGGAATPTVPGGSGAATPTVVGGGGAATPTVAGGSGAATPTVAGGGGASVAGAGPTTPASSGGAATAGGGTATATGNAGTATAGSSPLNVTLHVWLTPNRPGEVRVRAVYHNPGAATNHGVSVLKLATECDCFGVSPSERTRIRNDRTQILSKSGFVDVSGSATGWNLSWDGATAEPSVTYRIDVNETGSIGKYDDLVQTIDVGPWAWPGSGRDMRLKPNVRRSFDNVSYTVEPATPGVAAEGLTCLGCAVRFRRIHGQRVHFVYTPWADAPPAATDTLAGVIENASDDLRVGERDRDLYVFLLGGPNTTAHPKVRPNEYDGWYGGPSGGDEVIYMPIDGWNRSLSSRVTPRKRSQLTLIHEYVHTRQSFFSADGSKMCSGPTRGCGSWLLESQAKYYASVSAYYQGIYPNPTFSISGPRPFSADERNYPLDHDDHPLHTDRGARTLLALDWRIRNATGGDRSLDDVFRRLNDDGPPTVHAEFVRAADAVAGRSLSPFVSRYVTSTTTPADGAVPHHTTYGDPSWVRDGDGHWNTSLSLDANADAFLAPRHYPVHNGTVTFTLRNTGSDPAIGHAVDVRTPGGWQVADVTSTAGWWNASTGTWYVSELAAGETANLTVTFDPPAYPVPSVPNVSVAASDSDGNTGNVTLPMVPFAGNRTVVYLGSYVLPGGPQGGPQVGPPVVVPIDDILLPERIVGLTCPDPTLCSVLRTAGLSEDERVVAEVTGWNRTTGANWTRYYFARVENGTVTEFRAVEDPSSVDRTATVRTDAATVRAVWSADEPATELRKAVQDGRVTVDTGGLLGDLLSGLGDLLGGIGDLLGGIGDLLGGIGDLLGGIGGLFG